MLLVPLAMSILFFSLAWLARVVFWSAVLLLFRACGNRVCELWFGSARLEEILFFCVVRTSCRRTRVVCADAPLAPLFGKINVVRSCIDGDGRVYKGVWSLTFARRCWPKDTRHVAPLLLLQIRFGLFCGCSWFQILTSISHTTISICHNTALYTNTSSSIH